MIAVKHVVCLWFCDKYNLLVFSVETCYKPNLIFEVGIHFYNLVCNQRDVIY